MAWYTNEGFDKIASSKMIKCPKCGTMNSASAHKCKNCGHVFHSEKTAAKTATKTDPELWERSKAEAKAKMGGKHSARAMQLATQIYKKKGGGYSGAKPTSKNNSLKKWTKQDWQWSKEKKASEGKGVYLPAAKIQRLKSSSEGQKKLRAAERKKAKATKQGEQYSSHGLAAGTSLQKKAGAKYVGEAAILALMGNKRGLKYAEKYNQLGSGLKKQLLKDIPGTEGKYLIKNPQTREYLAEAMSHPEVALQVIAPFSPVHMPLTEAAKRKMIGVDDVKREIAKVKSKKRKKKLLDALGTVLSIAGGSAGGISIAKATESFPKTAKEHKDKKKLKKIVAELKKASKMHASQAERIDKIASVEYRGKTFPNYNKSVPSDKKDKKRMVLVKHKGKVKLVHFGQKGYEDFTQHKNKKRRENYLTRSAGIRNKDGKLTKDDPFSPNYWARKELW